MIIYLFCNFFFCNLSVRNSPCCIFVCSFFLDLLPFIRFFFIFELFKNLQRWDFLILIEKKYFVILFWVFSYLQFSLLMFSSIFLFQNKYLILQLLVFGNFEVRTVFTKPHYFLLLFSYLMLWLFKIRRQESPNWFLANHMFILNLSPSWWFFLKFDCSKLKKMSFYLLPLKM